MDEKEALAKALEPFEENLPEPKAAVLAYLRGEGPSPVEAMRKAPGDYYNHPSDFLSDSLPGAAERWHEPITDKLFALWAQLFDPQYALELSIGLLEDDTPNDLGRDRARIVFDKAVAHGVPAVHAAVVACRTQGASHWFFGPSFLARPEFFDEAAKVDLRAARALAVWAVPKMWLQHSPSVRKKLAAWLAKGSPALGAEALLDMLSVLPEAVEERHVPVDDDVKKTAQLAAKLEPRFPGVLARTSTRWMNAASPIDFVKTAANIVDGDAELLDKAAAWDRLLACIEAAPADPFPGDSFSGSILVEGLGRADAKLKTRLAGILAAHGATLELYYRKRFEKLVGKKPEPLPYDAKDLEGLEDGIKKAIETARTKSHAAGIKLPKGLAETAIAAAEERLGSRLPSELRAFFACHDGAGDDECFRGQTLFGLGRAVETRKTLLEGKGRPFDAAHLPITSDGAGNHACVVLSGKDAGHVVDFDHETGGGRKLAKSFAAYLKGAAWTGLRATAKRRRERLARLLGQGSGSRVTRSRSFERSRVRARRR
jgi:cell wall assembly regulator SMI1